MIKVALVDDHTIIRQGLKRILIDSGKVEVVSETGTIEELYADLKNIKLSQNIAFPNALILDLSLPKKGGFEALGEIREAYPEISILILSMHPADQYAIRTIKAGASGYLTKECATDELVKAVETIVAGGRYITGEVADLMAAQIQAGKMDTPSHTLLSDREFQVFMMIGQGVPLSNIAKSLYLSIKTISTYRLRTLTKMGMKSNADVVAYLIKNNLKR